MSSSCPERRKKSVDEYLRRALEYEEQGSYSLAIRELEKAVRVAQDKCSVYKQLADLCRRQRMVDQAIVALKKAVRLKRDDIEARETLLDIFLEFGHYDEAIHEAKEILKYSPRSLTARDALSLAYLQKGMLEKALQVINELISLDPTSPVNHFKKAVLCQQKGDIGNAIHEFSRVLEMQPDPEMAQDAERALENLDAYQLRHIMMLAVEDYIFRAKLARDPVSATLERGYYLSEAGIATLKQIQFDKLPEIYAEWKHRYYH